MCTVTYIPHKEGFFLTSSRDEKSIRQQALPPAIYAHIETGLVYPKDPDAGGTWIAMAENGNAAVLLNGAFKKHSTQPPYRKSRGKIFIAIIDNNHPLDYFTSVNLFNIEPFTIILIDNYKLYECRWDGAKKHVRQSDREQPAIWSSATLYDEEAINKRKQWFAAWLAQHPAPTRETILNFHRFGGQDDQQNGIRMNRDNKMFTVSITNIMWQPEKATMRYLDMKDNLVTEKSISYSLINEADRYEF
jgi:Transport and Golgi organisation 2